MTKKPTTIVFVVVAGIVVVYSGAMLCLYLVGLKSFRVPGGSMEPTISVGEHVLVNTRFYRKHEPQIGDVILYLFPSTDSRDPQYGQFYAKRIVATRGQSIEFRQKNLFRDGKPVGESYKVNSDPQFLSERDTLAPFVVPGGTVYVLGDNRDRSYDSRFIGPIPMVNVKGKVIAKGKLWRMSAI